ncbi:hypothetical protein EX30DRAFT_352258 [Ascodesmis nigricans]|uniref:Uncharacterized protein n=1 Tax=Ascodesmis nigricans TaxID=341454 RepID=A0A4S2MJ90_9PEZI|nr:hypothetical protein EX30DRAFT_352258 [Ascodesmis nigricans]
MDTNTNAIIDTPESNDNPNNPKPTMMLPEPMMARPSQGRIRSNSTGQEFTLQPVPTRRRGEKRASVLGSRAGNQVVSGFGVGSGVGISIGPGDGGVLGDAGDGGTGRMGMGRGEKTGVGLGVGAGTGMGMEVAWMGGMGRGRILQLPIGSPPPPRTPAGAVRHPLGPAVAPAGTASGTIAAGRGGTGEGNGGSGDFTLSPSLPGNLNVARIPDPAFEFAVFSDDEDDDHAQLQQQLHHQQPQAQLNPQPPSFRPFRPADSQPGNRHPPPQTQLPVPSPAPSPSPLFLPSPILPDNDPIPTPPLPPPHSTEPPETTASTSTALATASSQPITPPRPALPHRRQSYEQYCASRPIWQREWWENARRVDEGGDGQGFVDPREVMLRPVYDDADEEEGDDEGDDDGADDENDHDADQDDLVEMETRGIPIPIPIPIPHTHRTGGKTRGGGMFGGNTYTSTTGSWAGRKRAHSLSQIVEGEEWRVFTPRWGKGLGKSLPSVMEVYTPRCAGGGGGDGERGMEGDVEMVDAAAMMPPTPSMRGGRGARGERGARGARGAIGRDGARGGRLGGGKGPSIPPRRRRYTISTTSPSIDLGIPGSLLPPTSFPVPPPATSTSSQPPPSQPPSQIEPPPPMPSSPAPTHLLPSFHTHPPSPSTLPPPPTSASLTTHTSFHRSHLRYLITEIRLHTTTITTNPTQHNTRTAKRMLPGYVNALERLLVVLERGGEGEVEEGDFDTWREGWRGVGELGRVLGVELEGGGGEVVGRWWRAREKWGREREGGQQGDGE